MKGLIESFLEGGQKEGEVLVEAKNLYHGEVNNPLNYNNNQYFQANGQIPGEWWQVTFLTRFARINSYMIKTFDAESDKTHIKSWLLSASNDNETFINIEMRFNDEQLNGNLKQATFTLSKDYGLFRTFRITLISSHHPSFPYRLSINQFDIFGTLVESIHNSLARECLLIWQYLPLLLIFILIPDRMKLF